MAGQEEPRSDRGPGRRTCRHDFLRASGHTVERARSGCPACGSMDGMRLLRHLFDPGVPEPVEPASLLRMAKIMLCIDILVASGNIATRFMMPPGPDAGVYDVFLLWNVP